MANDRVAVLVLHRFVEIAPGGSPHTQRGDFQIGGAQSTSGLVDGHVIDSSVDIQEALGAGGPARACDRSAIRSSTSSVPADNRTRPSEMPTARRCAGVSAR